MRKLVFLLSLLLTLGVAATALSDDIRMDKENLSAMLGSSELIILDVRTGKDWSSSEFKIQGAVRAPGSEFSTWSETYDKNKTLVLYCA